MRQWIIICIRIATVLKAFIYSFQQNTFDLHVIIKAPFMRTIDFTFFPVEVFWCSCVLGLISLVADHFPGQNREQLELRKPLNFASYSFYFSESFFQFIHLEFLLDFYLKSMNFCIRYKDSKHTFSHVVCIAKEGEERGKREKRKSYCFIRFPPKKIMCLWEDSQKGVLSPFSSESIVHTHTRSSFNLNESFHHII